MVHDSYRLNLEYRASVENQLKQVSDQLLKGAIGVIAASRFMRRFQHEVATAWPQLGDILLTFVAIDSETDALPIGALRETWHPSTAAAEDQRIAEAEERFGAAANDASRHVLKLLEDYTITLWRPVGARELELIAASGMREFPPRLPEQPIFYPVLTEAYAVKIARDWNAPRGGGWVTCFRVGHDFLNRYPVREAGGRDHLEYWIPSEDLSAFNKAIVGQIEVTAEFPAAP